MFFAAFLALFNWYTFKHIADRWGWVQGNLLLFWAVALLYFAIEMYWLASALWLPHHRGARTPWGRKLFEAAHYASFLALGVFSVQFMYTFAGDFIGTALKFIAPHAALVFDAYNLSVVCALTGLTVLIGLVQAHTHVYVESVDVPLKNLPAAFDGFTIVQISDLHVSPMLGRDYVEKVVALANGLTPDMMALTGDFIDGTVDELQSDVAPLKNLSAPSGVYFVTGNHEYYWNPYAWMEHFSSLGLRVLANEHVVIRKGNEGIVVAGVTDYSTARSNRPDASDPAKAVAGAPAGLVKILLAHQPASFTAAEAAGVDLQLSGHTHAGQYFPFTLLIRFFQRYYKDLNRHGNTWLYVNTGTGFWGPPLRAGVPPEITRLRLVKTQ